MAETIQWTYQDAVDWVIDAFDLDSGSAARKTRRFAQRAVHNAYTRLPNLARWQFYRRQTIINTVASQTGTCTYDHTGGASERLLTLAGGITATTDFRYFRVIISDVHYDIETVVNAGAGTCTLSPVSNPGADVAAGTACTVYRSSYPLPVLFRKLGHVYDVDQERALEIITSDQQHSDNIYYYDTPDTPWRAAVRNAGEFLQGFSLVFSPPPSSAKAYDVIYDIAPQPLTIEKHSTGTVTTDGTATVEGAGTPAWAAKHVGQVMRFSSDGTDEPTSPVGNLDVDNPYTYQRIIHSVTDADTLVVDATVPTLTAVKYTISSPLDIEYHSMHVAFQRWAEYEMAVLLNDRTVEARHQRAMFETRRAMEADQRASYAEAGPLVYDKFRRTTITTDTG